MKYTSEDQPEHGPPQGIASSQKPVSQFKNPQRGPASNPGSGTQGGAIRLFRVAGIDVFLHWSWFLFALLSLQSSSENTFGYAHYESQVWNAVEYLALFGIVLLHEFGHVLACRSVGGIANRIVLWPLGGIAFVDPPARPGALLWSIAAGPLVNVLLLVPTIGFWMACRAAGLGDSAPDVYGFAAGLVSINAYLLLFNVLPVYPLDGGRMLQALLWFFMSRARSLLVAAGVGLVTAFGVLIVAIMEHSLVWGVIAAFGVFFSLVGLQGARGLTYMLKAPRRTEKACPACGATPPEGKFWACPRCWTPCDVFAPGGQCPNCSSRLESVLCPECGRSLPYTEWCPDAIVPEALENHSLSHEDAGAFRPTLSQRIVWGMIFAFCAIACCGLPNAEKQPLGLIVWTAAGAVFGALSAGAMTRLWRKNQALGKLRGTWRLVEEDGRNMVDASEMPRRLILKAPFYEERVGDDRRVRGSCWTDPMTNPAAISFTPATGADAGKPRPGIYQIKGECLTICLAHPDQPRPKAFLAEPDIQQMRVYRRGGKASD
jgi:uncharacterized protein (TIGR03067 family)